MTTFCFNLDFQAVQITRKTSFKMINKNISIFVDFTNRTGLERIIGLNRQFYKELPRGHSRGGLSVMPGVRLGDTRQ